MAANPEITEIKNVVEENRETLRQHGEILQRHREMLEQHGEMLHQQGEILQQHSEMLMEIVKEQNHLRGMFDQMNERINEVESRLSVSVQGVYQKPSF